MVQTCVERVESHTPTSHLESLTVDPCATVQEEPRVESTLTWS